MTEIESFNLKFVKYESCWEWTGSKNRKGYGQFRIKNIMYIAHRFSYELFKGPIPEGLFVCHSCDNPSCVNPGHLWVGTAKDNAMDRERKKRGNGPGEKCNRHKLTETQVKEIREKYVPWTYSLRRLAKEYGVSAVAIHLIITNKNWSSI